MNDEDLSAWVDGECDLTKLDEILEEFSKDPQLRQRYSRLRMARDSRRGVIVRDPDFTFADRVMIAIERDFRVASASGDVRMTTVPVAADDPHADIPVAAEPIVH